MRRLSIFFLILILAAGAGAWWWFKTDRPGVAAIAPDAKLARLEGLADAVPAGARADEAALRSLAAGFDDRLEVVIGAVASDADGAVASDVVITLKGDAAFGARIGELRAWGVNEGAGAEGRVADRLDARNIEFFGLDALAGKYADWFADSVDAAVSDADVSLTTALETTFKSYEYRADRMVIDGLTFHPVAVAAMDDKGPMAVMLQQIAVYMMASSADAYVVHGMSLTADIEQSTGDTTMTMLAPFSGALGWRRGDTDYTAVRDMTFDMAMTTPATDYVDEATGETVATPAISMTFGGSYEFFSAEDFRLAKLMAYLAKGETPPATETDLLSLGKWRIRGERQTFGGHEISYTGEAFADLSDFHWFVPKSLRFTATGARYNLAAFFGYISEMATASAPDAESGQLAGMQQALEDAGLAVIEYDADFAANWNPDNGETSSRMEIAAPKFLNWNQSVDIVLPDYAALSALIPQDGAEFDDAAAEKALQEALAFNRGAVAVTDLGVVAKGFAAAVAFAKLAPEDDAGAAMLRDANPEDLRVSSAAMMRMTAAQAAQAFPPAEQYMQAAADFIQKSGTLRVESTPPAPVTAALLESEQQAIAADPGRIAEIFGLTVTHEPE